MIHNWVIKWYLFFWFIFRNWFNIKKAEEEATQTLRKLEWDEKVGQEED